MLDVQEPLYTASGSSTHKFERNGYSYCVLDNRMT